MFDPDFSNGSRKWGVVRLLSLILYRVDDRSQFRRQHIWTPGTSDMLIRKSAARQELVQVRPQCPRRQYQPGQGMVPFLQIRRLTVIIINGTAQRTSSVCLVLVRQQCKLSRQTMDPIQLDVKLQFCAGLAQSPGPNPQLTPDACAAEQGRSMPTLHCWTRPVTLHRLQPLASDGASSDMRHCVDRTNR